MAMSPVPPAAEDVNPAIDDNVGPEPNVNDDHTIIVIGGSGPDNLHPAAERSDSGDDPAAEDAVMEDVPVDEPPDARLAPGDVHVTDDAIEEGTSGRRTRASSKRGPRKTTNDKNKTIKSLRNKLYYKSNLPDAAADRVGVLNSENKKLQDECKDLASGGCAAWSRRKNGLYAPASDAVAAHRASVAAFDPREGQ